MKQIFEPYDLAGHLLKNRVVMAPMTRSRAVDDVPDEMVALYYRQRASAGLIISEGSPVSRQGQGYIANPGLYGPDQVAGWKKSTHAVHEKGGIIFAQIWHVGRVSHTSIQVNGAAPVSSSDKAGGTAYGYQGDGTPGRLPASAPRPLATAQIGEVVADFETAAVNARLAGFDGVEIHGANGYLFEQFFNPEINDRSDVYGGSRENRCRLLLEVVDRLAARLGANRVGVRLSPFSTVFDMPSYADNGETYLYLAEQLGKRGIAYVHLNDEGTPGAGPLMKDYLGHFRRAYHGNLLLAGKLQLADAERLVSQGLIDLPVFGKPFIANPDLVERLKNGWPLAEYDARTLYGGDARGYVDYPTYLQEQARQAALASSG